MNWLCLVLLSLAALPAVIAAPATLVPRAVSATVLARLNLFEQYSAAAYCPLNNNSTGDKVTCSVGNCPLVEAASTTTLIEFENSNGTDVTGFVARDDTNKLIVVSFRGSESFRNWLVNINFGLTSATDICTGCMVHTGFYDSWQEAKASVLASLKAAAETWPTYQVVATGHSLGAAIATLAVADLANDGYTIGLFGYGSPRVGNAAFAAYVSGLSNETYRVTHADDVVPRLPAPISGFVHVYGQYWITSANYVPVTAAAITVFTGDANNLGNAATATISTTAHGWYFNNISSCDVGGDIEYKRSVLADLSME